MFVSFSESLSPSTVSHTIYFTVSFCISLCLFLYLSMSLSVSLYVSLPHSMSCLTILTSDSVTSYKSTYWTQKRDIWLPNKLKTQSQWNQLIVAFTNSSWIQFSGFLRYPTFKSKSSENLFIHFINHLNVFTAQSINPGTQLMPEDTLIPNL